MAHSPVELGPLQHQPTSYGVSHRGVTLECFEPGSGPSRILLMGAIHGDESLSTILLSEGLRSIENQELKSSVILSANPDGVLAGTRCNARGVDLNRNFPTKNWLPAPVYSRNQAGSEQNIALSPGETAGSERETSALITLIEKLKPSLVVSIHGFLACIDDPDESAIAKDIALRSNMELVPDVGYSTPGSFGSWCQEQNLPVITYELPPEGIDELRRLHMPIIKDLMTGRYDSKLA